MNLHEHTEKNEHNQIIHANTTTSTYRTHCVSMHALKRKQTPEFHVVLQQLRSHFLVRIQHDATVTTAAETTGVLDLWRRGWWG